MTKRLASAAHDGVPEPRPASVSSTIHIPQGRLVEMPLPSACWRRHILGLELSDRVLADEEEHCERLRGLDL